MQAGLIPDSLDMETELERTHKECVKGYVERHPPLYISFTMLRLFTCGYNKKYFITMM